jgi:hypothetical protein
MATPGEEVMKHITDFAFPTSLYQAIPEDREIKISLILYLLSCKMGSCTNQNHYGEHTIERHFHTNTATVNISSSTPTISLPTVVDTKAATKALTGDASKLIRYASTAKLTANIEARNGAYIEADETTVHCGGVTKPYSYVNGATFENVAGNKFEVSARDSRGLSTRITYELPAERFIEYFPPTCNIGNDRPNTNGVMTVTCSGNYFNGSFGAQSNTLTVQYRYREQGGTVSDWTNMTASINGNKYTASATLSGLDYQKTYVFECRATDKVTTVSADGGATKAVPLFHWNEKTFTFETNVHFKKGFLFGEDATASDIIEEQSIIGSWVYRKWHSGRVECWGTFTKSIKSTDWTPWGSLNQLYQAAIITNEPYPFTITSSHEIATLLSLSGAFLSGMPLGKTNTTTGAYSAVHPNKLTSTYGCTLNLYVSGYWK